MVLCFVAIGLFLHQQLRARDLERNQQSAIWILAESIAAQFQPDSSICAADLQASCERLVRHPAITAASLWGQTGEMLAAAGLAPSLVALARPEKETGIESCREVPVPAALAGHVPRLLCVDVPLGTHFQKDRPATLCLLVASDKLLPQPAGHFWGYYLPMLATGVGLMYLGQKQWARLVTQPMAEIMGLFSVRDEPAVHPVLAGRDDAWGRLAQCVLELRGEAGSWRSYAHRAERRVDQQLADETRRISHDLKQAERKSYLDPLTGLGNRRLLNERLPTVLATQRAAQKDLAVLMFDLDHFKKLNDSLGHAAGDEILSFAGELLSAVARAGGLAIRYGGDEFLLILPGTGATRAVAIAERIIAMFVQRVKMMGPECAAVSMTAGIATLWQHSPSTPQELIVMADRALYQGKRAGKKGARIYAQKKAAV